MPVIRVGVVGAAGRMGSEVCRAVHATEDLQVVAAVDPSRAGESLADVAGIDARVTIAESLDALLDADVDVAVEFTGPETVGENLAWLLEHGLHAVVGATGLSAQELHRARTEAAANGVHAIIAPNFAIGAVLLMRFAAEAAKHLPHVEVLELHHDRKVDAPSGTALRTAELIADSREATPERIGGDDAFPGARGVEHDGVRIHSVRLPGLVAHQEVVFGGQGQTLTIRHDSLDRTSFMPGVLLACRKVPSVEGVVVGLEHLL